MKLATSLFLLALVFASASHVRADLAPEPRPSKARLVLRTNLVVTPDSKATEARLQITSRDLREISAALKEADEGGAAAAAFIRGKHRTFVAGISLFLALSLSGVWLVRSGSSRAQKTLAVVLLGFAMLGAAAVLTRANAGPPPALRWRNLPTNLSDGKATSGQLNVEIVPDGSGMKLILPLERASRGDD